jgi:hypothetical protein
MLAHMGESRGRLLTMVASIIEYSMSGSSEAASNSRLNTLARAK